MNHPYYTSQEDAATIELRKLREEISELKKENSKLRNTLYSLRTDIAHGEHIDSDWIENTLKEQNTHPVIESAVKMLRVREGEIQKLRVEIDKYSLMIHEQANREASIGMESQRLENEIQKRDQLLEQAENFIEALAISMGHFESPTTGERYEKPYRQWLKDYEETCKK